jgi:hypothetical protein
MDRLRAETAMPRRGREMEVPNPPRNRIMNSKVTKILLALGATVMLGACASLSNVHEATAGEGTLAKIQYGLTKDEVRGLAGAPKVVRNEPRLEETLWIYYYTDEWNYASEFDVSFDTAGAVSDISTARLHY